MPNFKRSLLDTISTNLPLILALANITSPEVLIHPL
nr:MAG TPA: hypothetical protein [Bacteriophage sp.]